MIAVWVLALTLQGVEVHNGFLTGQSYRDLSEASRQAYVMGVIDGMFASTIFDAPKNKIRWLEDCVSGNEQRSMSAKQLDAIMMKFVNDHPERWNESMHAQVYTALGTVCPGGPVRQKEKP